MDQANRRLKAAEATTIAPNWPSTDISSIDSITNSLANVEPFIGDDNYEEVDEALKSIYTGFGLDILRAAQATISKFVQLSSGNTQLVLDLINARPRFDSSLYDDDDDTDPEFRKDFHLTTFSRLEMERLKKIQGRLLAGELKELTRLLHEYEQHTGMTFLMDAKRCSRGEVTMAVEAKVKLLEKPIHGTAVLDGEIIEASKHLIRIARDRWRELVLTNVVPK